MMYVYAPKEEKADDASFNTHTRSGFSLYFHINKYNLDSQRISIEFLLKDPENIYIIKSARALSL